VDRPGSQSVALKNTEPTLGRSLRANFLRQQGSFATREIETEDLHHFYARGEQLYIAEDYPNLYRIF
jgi:hypothetical protein